jgi:hypothetical protein
MRVIDWTDYDATISHLRKRERMNAREIAGVIGLEQQSVRRRMVYLGLIEPPATRGPIQRSAASQEPAVPSDMTIVDMAHRVLKAEGFTDRRLSIMSLDERMRTANRFLAQRFRPQLGKNPAWIHK